MEGKLLQMLFLGSMYGYKATCVCSLKLCLRAYLRCDMFLYVSLFKLAFFAQIEYEPQHIPTHHISHGPFINPRLMLLWMSLSPLLTRGQRGRQPDQFHQSIIHLLKLQFKKRRVKFEKLRKLKMEGILLQMLFLGSMYIRLQGNMCLFS